MYYVGSSNRIYERQEKSNNTNSWANDNLSGRYTAANISSLSVYWAQNMTNTSQALVVLFQEEDRASTFSIGKYTSYGNVSNDWVETKYSFTVQEGSPFSMIPLTGPQDLLIYAVGGDKRLAQFRYNVSSDTVLEYGCKHDTRKTIVLILTVNSLGPISISKDCSHRRHSKQHSPLQLGTAAGVFTASPLYTSYTCHKFRRI